MARNEKPDASPVSARRRLDEVFGDVLPETTSDERDPRSPNTDDDAWYLENRPPHHDR